MHRVEENADFRGVTTIRDLKANDGCIGNAHVAVGAGVAASKLQHQHRVVLAQESDTAATDETHVAHVVHGTAGKLLQIKAGCVVPCVGADTITIDLLKAGVSVLAAPITLTSAQAARQLVVGSIDTDTLAAGDVLEIEVDAIAAAGTMGKGPFVYVDLEEDYS